MTTTTEHRSPAAWDEPEGVAARGTLILLTGRGETASTYKRFGRRISFDGYRVRAVPTRPDDLDRTREDVAALLADPGLPGPRVLAGSDTGATAAAVLAPGLEGVDALLLAGLVPPGARAPQVATWQAELEARTSCPTHRGVLDGDRRFDRGALGTPLPRALAEAALRPSDLPTLLLHGRQDPVAPAREVFAALGGPAATRTVLVADGRHDVLNDISHRSVAATVVLFLESLRLGPGLPDIVHAPQEAADPYGSPAGTG